MSRKLLFATLILSVLAHGFIYWKSQRRSVQHGPYSYLSNYQYTEQTSIFGAYETNCQIAFIGDSHVYKCHWSELLGMVVCNRGIGSDITEGVYKRIAEVKSGKPKICFIACGSNDIDLKIDPDTTIGYFRKIVGELIGAGIKPVIMEITPVAPGYPNKSFNEKAAALNQRLRLLGETISITVDPRDIQPDGIHLTAMGYHKWKVAVGEYLAR